MSQSKVNAKLFKSKKVDLKTRKVNLNKFNELQETLDRSSGIYYTLDESGFLDAFDVVRNAYSYVEYEFGQDFNYAEEVIEELELSLDELGIEHPPELLDAKERLEEQREAVNELIDLFSQLRASIPEQQKY
tara:strand:+ start:233 stop:628 length:396 start_codon:yes stop_codon:yes gene_type:complete